MWCLYLACSAIDDSLSDDVICAYWLSYASSYSCLHHMHIFLAQPWLILHYFADPAPGPSTSRWASQALGLGYLLHIAHFLILVHAFWPSALHCFTVHVLYGLRPSYCFTGFDYSGFYTASAVVLKWNFITRFFIKRFLALVFGSVSGNQVRACDT